MARSLVQDFGFTNLHMGRPLKDMLIALGLTERDVAGTPEERALPQPLLGGKSARDAMKSLGTDWARNMVTPDLWANAIKLRLVDHFSTVNPSPVVIDDLRFPNDWAVVKDMGGMILAIRRPDEPRRTVFDQVVHRVGLGRLPKLRHPRSGDGFSPCLPRDRVVESDALTVYFYLPAILKIIYRRAKISDAKAIRCDRQEVDWCH